MNSFFPPLPALFASPHVWNSPPAIVAPAAVLDAEAASVEKLQMWHIQCSSCNVGKTKRRIACFWPSRGASTPAESYRHGVDIGKKQNNNQVEAGVRRMRVRGIRGVEVLFLSTASVRNSSSKHRDAREVECLRTGC